QSRTDPVRDRRKTASQIQLQIGSRLRARHARPKDFKPNFGLTKCRPESPARIARRPGIRKRRKIDVVYRPLIAEEIHQHDARNPHPVLGGTFRSEEHTSELQSLTNLVCRLLLEN